jgi:hypothetical protein
MVRVCILSDMRLESYDAQLIYLSFSVFPCTAVPSRASLEQSQWQCGHRHGDRCPHVMTIPLLFQKEEDDDDSEEIYNSATTPIQFLASDDFSVGVAFVHHSKVRALFKEHVCIIIVTLRTWRLDINTHHPFAENRRWCFNGGYISFTGGHGE